MAVEKLDVHDQAVDWGQLQWAWMMACANYPSARDFDFVLPPAVVDWSYGPAIEIAKKLMDSKESVSSVLEVGRDLNLKFAESFSRLYDRITEHQEYHSKPLEPEVTEWYMTLLLDLLQECKIYIRKHQIISDGGILEDDFTEKAIAYLKDGLARSNFKQKSNAEILRNIVTRVMSEIDLTGEVISRQGHMDSTGELNNKKPDAAPGGELYASHGKNDRDIVAFINRVYGERGYLTGEFTRADLGRIDPSARTALDNWERKTATRPKRRAPLNLPTLKEFNDRALAAAPSLVRPEAAREYDRVRALVKRRNLE